MAVSPGGIDLEMELDTRRATAELRRLTDEINRAIGSADKMQKALTNAVGALPTNARQLQQALRTLQGGGIDASINKALNQGSKAQLANSPVGQLSSQYDLLNKAAKSSGNALRSLALESAALNRQIYEGNKAEQQKTNILQRQIQLAQALNAAGGARTAEVIRAEGRLQASERLLERLNRLERERTEEVRRRAREEERAKRAADKQSPASRAARAQEVRTQRDEILFGDGGSELFKIQSRLLIQYQVLNTLFTAARSAAGFILEFDRSLFQLQAISASTNAEILKLKDTIIDVSQSTKFSAVEVAEAATIMAQAGLSVSEIGQAIGPVTLLATATGSTLAEAVDLATSAISVFNMQASEMGNVADIATGALNLTKLTMDKLILGVQYAGNVAADAGVGFNELVAVLGQFSNAGVRSGSTLGTGVRQLIVDLEAPTEKLKTRLRELGVSTQEIDIKANGLVGVLKNLRAAGFTTADAIETMEVRAVAAFSALAKGTQDIDALMLNLANSTASVDANAVQMQSLANILSRLGSAVGVLASEASGPLVDALKDVADWLTAVAKGTSEWKGALEVLGTLIGALVAARFTALLVGLTGITRLMTTLVPATAAASAGVTTFGASMAVLSRSFFLNPAALAAIGVFAAIGLLTDGFGLLSAGADDYASKLDNLKTKVNETKGYIDNKAQSVSTLDGFIRTVVDRSARLSKEEGELASVVAEAKNKFYELGLQMGDNVSSVDQLLEALFNLRESLSQDFVMNMKLQIDQQLAQVQQQEAAFIANRQQNVEKFLRDNGLIKQVQDTSGVLGRFSPFAKDELAVPEFLKGGVSALQSGNRDQIRAAMGQLLDLTRQPSATSGLDDQQRDLTHRLIQELDTMNRQLGSNEGLRGEIASLQNSLPKVEMEQRFGTVVDRILSEADVYRKQQIDTRLPKDASLEDTKRITGEIDSQVTDYIELRIQDILRTPGVDAATFRQVFQDKIKNSFTSGRNELGNLVESTATGLVETMKQEISTLGEEIDVVKARLSSGQGDKKQLYARARDLIIKKGELEGKVRMIEDRALASDIQSRRQSALAGSVQNELFSLDTTYGRRKKRDTPKNLFTYDPDRDAFRKRESIKDEIALINQANERAQFQAGIPSRDLGFQISSLDLIRNRGRDNSALKFKLQKEQEGLQTEQLKKTAELELKHVSDLQAAQEAAKTSIRDLGVEFAQLQQKLEDGSGVLTDKEANRIKARRDEIGNNITSLESQVIKAQEGIAEATEKAATAQAEYNARVQETQKLGFDETLRLTVEQWAQSSGVMDDFNTQMAQGLVATLETVRTGLAQTVTDVVLGNQKMGEAFKQFGLQVLETMTKMLAQMAINQMLQLILGAALGPGGSAGFGPSSGPSSPLFGAPARNATGGSVRGGIPGRDSVHTMLEPGEFVVKRSAAQSIGLRNLQAMNQGVMPVQPVGVPAGGEGEGGDINIWVVQDQGDLPTPDARNIIAIVGRDIETGGPLRRLIKSVPR